MNSIQLYLEEELDARKLGKVKKLLLDIEHVIDVEISSKSSHELVVDFDAFPNMPMKILEVLKAKGYHPDIYSG